VRKKDLKKLKKKGMTEKSTTKTTTIMTGTSGTPGQVGAKKNLIKVKKPRIKPNHPRTADMVDAAIKTLKDRTGSSLQAIKKYISSVYKMDAEKHAPFIKRYIKAAVTNGELVQTKGKGAAGSFKLSTKKPDGKKIILKKKPITTSRVSSLKKSPPAKKAPAAKKPVAKKLNVKKSPKKTVAVKRKPIKGPAAKPPKAKSTSVIAKTSLTKAKALPKKQKARIIKPKEKAIKSGGRRRK
jgi:histone H1/5